LYVAKKGYWNDIQNININNRAELTNFLWEFRSKIAKLYMSIVPYVADRRKFSIQKNNISIIFFSNYNVEITIEGKKFSFENWKDFPIYITGGWFEEYTYMKLKPLEDNGTIYDLRIGLEVGFKEQNNIKISKNMCNSFQE